MVRITGGEFRSRRLATLEGEATRPSGERLRESLFNRLLARLPGARVLDLFAGSGALAFEALSRGAKSAVLIDVSPASVRILEQNRDSLGVGERAHIVQRDALQAMDSIARYGPFEFVFLDPPYTAGLYEPALRALREAGLLAPEGMAICEHLVEEKIEATGWKNIDLRRYGRMAVSWWVAE